jgi:hypothetical protein
VVHEESAVLTDEHVCVDQIHAGAKSTGLDVDRDLGALSDPSNVPVLADGAVTVERWRIIGGLRFVGHQRIISES